MFAYSNPFTGVGLILATWLIMAFLPRVLGWLKLQDRINSEHLSLLFAALLGFTVFITIFAPLTNTISTLLSDVMYLFRR